MLRRILASVLVCLFLSTSGMVGNAQENPFDRLPVQVESARKRKPESREQMIKRLVLTRSPVFESDKVTKLLKENPADDKVRSLKKERCLAAFEEVEVRFSRNLGGAMPLVEVLKASTRLSSSLLAIEPDASTRVAILTYCLEAAKEVEDSANKSLRGGHGTRQDVAQAKYERLSAEILLAETKAQLQAKDNSVSAAPTTGQTPDSALNEKRTD